MPTRTSPRSLAEARLALAKRFPEALAPLKPLEDIKVAHTGAILLDAALGVGGFPFGRLTELFGMEGTGKSSLAMSAMGDVQRTHSKQVVWFDYEHSFDPTYAAVCGLDTDPDQLMVAQPRDFETGMEMLEFLLENNSVGGVVVDSTASMPTRKELEGDVGDSHMAPLARAMSQEFRRLVPMIDRSDCVVIFINQLRELIGGFNPTGQIRTVTPGGKALKFYSSVRVELRNIKSIKGKITDPATGQKIDGNVAVQVRAAVVKNKVGPPFRFGTYYLEAGRGIDDTRTILEVCESRGIVQRNGSRYVLPFRDSQSGDKINLAGNLATVTWLKKHPNRRRKLEDRVLQLVRGTGPGDITHAGTIQESERPAEEEAEGDEEAASSEGENGAGRDEGLASSTLEETSETSGFSGPPILGG